MALGTASACLHSSWKGPAALLKVAAATGYMALAWHQGALETAYGRLLLTGLALCWLGDLLLIPQGSGRAFLGGLAAFLLGHLAYAVAFTVAGVAWGWVGTAALPMAVVGGLVLRWLWAADLPLHMRVPVVSYVAAISAMVALAWGAAGAGMSWVVPAGAAAFLASDIFVARQRFVTPSPWNTLLGLPLYFSAQGLLALSV